MSLKTYSQIFVGMGISSIIAFAGTSVYAALTAGSTLSQQITAGTISTDIRNSSNAIVASPSFAMGSVNISTSQQVSTGVFGEAAQRISVDNPGGANNGWTLTLNATVPGTGTWTSGVNTYAYNSTAALGQLTVNASAGTLTPLVGTATGITRGTSGTFTASAPITLLTAALSSDDIWNGYLTGVSLSQTIPASKPAGSYSISMTQTVTAL